MNRIVIEVFRFGEWRKLTTIEYDPNRERAVRRGDVMDHTRATAVREGIRHLTSWAGYFTDPLRLVDFTGYRGTGKVVSGRKS